MSFLKRVAFHRFTNWNWWIFHRFLTIKNLFKMLDFPQLYVFKMVEFPRLYLLYNKMLMFRCIQHLQRRYIQLQLMYRGSSCCIEGNIKWNLERNSLTAEYRRLQILLGVSHEQPFLCLCRFPGRAHDLKIYVNGLSRTKHCRVIRLIPVCCYTLLQQHSYSGHNF